MPHLSGKFLFSRGLEGKRASEGALAKFGESARTPNSPSACGCHHHTSSSARNKNNTGGRPLHVSLEAEESYLAPPGRSRRNRNDGRIKGRGQKENNSNNNNKEQQQQHRAALHTDNIFGEEREEERSSSSLPAAFLPNITATGTISSPLSNLKQPRIIGGQSTVRDRYPYTTSLIDTSSTNRHVCGGSLIAPDIVLTAGHCSGAFDSVQIGRHNIIDGELEAALAGGDIVDMNDPNAEVEDGYEYHVVERHVVHPLHSNIIRSDFALAKLYGSVSTVQPVKLNTDPSIPSNDEMVTVMGYGIIQKEGTIFNDMSTVLLEADVQYMPNAECAMISAPFNGQTVAYNGYVDDNMLCAWQLGTDACQGDSGGPLVYSINNNPKDDVQIGIVSWGLGCALEAFPGVYSRISEEMDWLTEQVCDLSDDPPEYFNCTGGQQQQQSGLVGGATTQDVTVVVELDENPQEVAWMMELDLSNGGGNGGKVSEDTYKPFGSFTLPSTTAVEVLSLVVDKQYKFTVLDRGSDNKNTKFRLCYGNVSIRECMGAKTTDEDSIIVCEGISRYNLITSASCPVVLQTARPTPRPTVSVSAFPLCLQAHFV